MKMLNDPDNEATKDQCICRCGRNIIEDKKVVIIDEGKETEEHLCLKCLN